MVVSNQFVLDRMTGREAVRLCLRDVQAKGDAAEVEITYPGQGATIQHAFISREMAANGALRRKSWNGSQKAMLNAEPLSGSTRRLAGILDLRFWIFLATGKVKQKETERHRSEVVPVIYRARNE